MRMKKGCVKNHKKLVELLTDDNGHLYCKRCFKQVSYEDIDKEQFERFKQRNRR